MSEQSVFKIGRNDGEACPDRAVAFVRRLYPTKTADCVAADTGLSAQTVRRWLEGVAKPSWAGFSRLILAYGPAFLVAVYPNCPRWLDEAHQRERLADLEARQAAINTELTALRAQL